MSKIRVLILVDKFDFHGSGVSGPLKNYTWLMQRIENSRFEIYLYALRKAGRSSKIFLKEKVSVGYLGLGRFNPLTFLTVSKLIRKHKIDIVHLQGYGAVVFGQIAGILTRRPIIIKEEWVDPDIGRMHCWLERILNLSACRVIAISNYARKFLTDKKKVARHKIVNIPNGIPLDRFNGNQHIRHEKRKEWQISDNQIVVGIVGMLHENKGHQYFIEAASQIVRKHPDARFLIVGEGEQRAKLEKQVDSLLLGNNVLFMGQQEKMEEIYPMMNIYVLASSTETLPTSLIEAMASGVAVVSTRCGGSEELLVDNESGLLVPVRDSDALSRGIIYLIENNEERIRLGINAAIQSEKHDINKTVAEIQNLYENVFNQYTRKMRR